MAQDPANDDEETWCAEQRDEVVQYLRGQGLDHGEIGEIPAWFICPNVAVWAVESLRSPGSVGWWVMSGDLPTDYCSSGDCRHPRLALKRMVAEWDQAIKATRFWHREIGSTGLPARLLPMLKVRVELLSDIAGDDAAWPE